MTGRAVLTPKLNALNAAVRRQVRPLDEFGHRVSRLPVGVGYWSGNWRSNRAWRTGATYPAMPNGERERARRRRQIARGMLRVTG